MSNPVKIYHNPRCSKSRATLALLRENNIEPEIIDYLQQPLGAEQLGDILNRLGKTPRDIIRRGEAVYRELGLDDTDLSNEALLQAMAENPILVERPIVTTAKGAALGRPPETVLEIL